MSLKKRKCAGETTLTVKKLAQRKIALHHPDIVQAFYHSFSKLSQTFMNELSASFGQPTLSGL